MNNQPTKPNKHPRGISLVEVTISVVIMSTMMVTSLNLVAAAKMTDLKSERIARGQQLAQQLLTEILQKPYRDTTTTPRFGVENDDNYESNITVAGTTTKTGRERFDDIDDYNDYIDDPPSNLGHLKLRSSTDWSRHVTVDWVEPNAPNTTSNVETGTKRITLQVKYLDALVSTLVAYRTLAWDATLQNKYDANNPPVAIASADTNHGPTPLTVSFDAALSFDPENQPLTYEWDFGDDQTATGATPQHTYTRGVYNITLTVTDPLGAIHRNTTTIFVRKAD